MFPKFCSVPTDFLLSRGSGASRSPESIEPLETRIAPALVMAISDGNLSTTPGSTLTYTIGYANDGEDAASAVVLTDVLPAGTTFDAAENPGWSEDAGVLSFAAGDVAAGANGSATLVLHVAPVATAGVEEIVNTVGIARGGATEPETTASDTTSLVAAPDLAVTKTPDAEGSVTPGETIHYSIAYGNVGNQDATGVVLTEHLPAGTSFDSLNSSEGWTAVEGSVGLYQLVVGSVGGGTNGTKTFAVKVNDTALAAQEQISNTIDISDDGANGADPTPANNTSLSTLTLDAAPDLTLTKTNGVDHAQRGQTLTYTLGYGNAGNQNATGVIITETLPEGVSFDAAANPGWSLDGTTLTFTVGSLAAGANGSATLVLHVNDNAPLSLTQIANTAAIADDGANGVDLTPGNNTATDTDPLLAPIDLTLTKTDGLTTVAPGESLTYTFNYGNEGGIDAHGVVLTDALPAGTSFDPVANPGWVLNNGTLTFAAGDLDAGASGTATLVLTATSIAPAGLAAIHNTATIADDGTGGADLNLANNTADDFTTLDATPDLTLSKTAGAASVAPGGSITFTFDYANAGNRDAAGVTLTDILPAGTTFDAAANPGWSLNGSTLTYPVGNLAGGANGTVSLVLGVAAAAPAGLEQIANDASISDDGTGGADPTPANNASHATVAFDAAPDLTLTKTDGRTTAMRGHSLTYTFDFTNAGNQGASGVVITDTLPEGTTFDAAENPGWTFDSQSGVLTFAVGGLAAGANGTATLVLKVADTLPEGLISITNTANIADDGAGGSDPTPANNSATDIDTIVSGAVDLTLQKTSESTSLTPGSTVTYTFTFGNAGDTDASGLVITDVLPTGTTFNEAANPGWVLDGTTLTYAISGLTAGANGTATLTLGIASTVPAGLEQIVNSASIADDGTHGTDFNTSDNSASLTLPLNAAPDLTITQSNGGAAVTPGSTITYTFNYTNAGTQHANGVVITDTLPNGTTFDAAANPGWTLNGNTLTYSVGAVNAGSNGTATLILKAATSVPAGQASIVNVASIADDGTSGADLTPADNTSTATNTLTSSVDLALTIGSSNTTTPGGSLVFTLNYSNAGNQTAPGVVLTENLPSGTTFNAAGSTAGWTETSPGVYKLVVGALDGGASGSATFAVNVTSPATASLEQIFDTASITSDATESSTSNNSAQKSVTLNAAPNLGVTVTSSSVKVSPGGVVTYTISYTNTGDQNASGVKLTETLPAGLSYLATGSTAGWTNVGTRIYEFTVGALAAGQSGTVTFVAKASSGLSASNVTDRVEITDDGTSGADSSPANNETSLVLPVKKNGVSNPTPSVSGGKGVWAMADDGQVKLFSKSNGALVYKFRPYGDDVKHVKVAMADFNGDGVADIVTSSKESSKVRVYDGRTGLMINSFKPFGDVDSGLRVFVWDVNGDGVADILAKQRDGDGKVRVFDGASIMTTVKPSPFTTLQA